MLIALPLLKSHPSLTIFAGGKPGTLLALCNKVDESDILMVTRITHESNLMKRKKKKITILLNKLKNREANLL